MSLYRVLKVWNRTRNCTRLESYFGVRQSVSRERDSFYSPVGCLVVLALECTKELVDLVLHLLELDGLDGGELELADDGEALSRVTLAGWVGEQHVDHEVAEGRRLALPLRVLVILVLVSANNLLTLAAEGGYALSSV